MTDEAVHADAGVIEEHIVETPAEEAVVETQVEMPAVDAEVSQKAAHVQKKLLERINEETNAKRSEREARLAAEKRADDLREMLERIQRGEKADAVPERRQPTPDPDKYMQDVRAEAARLRLIDDGAAIRAAGQKAFPDFEASVENLASVGAASDEVLSDVMIGAGRENAHIIFDRLAKDLVKADQIARMDSRSRIAEITRMSMAEAQPKPTALVPAAPAKPAAKISNAPTPKPPLDPAGSPNNDGWFDDSSTDEQFYAGFKAKYKLA